MHRRDFHRQLVAMAAGSATTSLVAPSVATDQAAATALPIIDTHQHLWNLEQQEVPWLENAPPVLRRSYVTRDYQQATRGLNITKAIYMEVNVAPRDHWSEVERVTRLCASSRHPTVAAVVGGHPAADTFARYAARVANNPYVKGIRRVLHGGTPRGHCLSEPFVRSMQRLGELDLSFDLCLRPGELRDAVRLVDQCPDTRFILDHCGNADPKAFWSADRGGAPAHDPDLWRRAMDALGRREQVVCKISGIIARVPPAGWSADDLAPIVKHCLEAFGSERVVFGSDWPVCRVGAELAQWVNALRSIIQDRPLQLQRNLLHANAQRIYRLEA